MKKKILIGTFLLVVLITAIVFIVEAVASYKYDMDPANGVDILEGVGAGIAIMCGGLVVLCELDVFFTVYYFVVKPKTVSKTAFMILSQAMIVLVIFSFDLSRFLSQNVSKVFGEESIVMVPIFLLYVVLRLICVSICFFKKS